MTKARDLADLISAGNPLADGAIDVSEVTGAAPTASPTFTGTVTLPGATSTADITLGDNDKAIFGDGSDLQIYHDGSNSYVDDAGAGDLYIRANNLRLTNADGSEQTINTNNGAGVQLAYTGNIKLATTSTGVDITGSVTGTEFIDSDAPTYKVNPGGTSTLAYAYILQSYGYNSPLSGTTPTVSAGTFSSFSLTTSGNTTFTFGAAPNGYTTGFVLYLTAGGTHTITWPASVDWAGGTAPDAPASGETDVLVFVSKDGGTTWYGALSIDAAV